MNLNEAICRGLRLPDKESQITANIKNTELVKQAISFFANKRGFNPKYYKDLDLEEIVYRLQKQYPEFCLLCYWHDNGISRQQSMLIEEHPNLDWIYSPADLMKAYWASGLCKTIKEIKGAVWPVMGYSKEVYEQLDPQEDRILIHQIKQQLKNYRDWETLWAAPISFQSPFQIVGYALYFTEVLSKTRSSYEYTDWDSFVSNWLWNGDAVASAVNWTAMLVKTTRYGQGKLTVYQAITQCLGNRFKNLFSYLEQDEYFRVVYSNDEIWKKSIYLRAIHEGRQLTKVESNYIKSRESEDVDIDLEKINELRKSISAERISNIFSSCNLPDDMYKITSLFGELDEETTVEILKDLVKDEFWTTKKWHNMKHLESTLTKFDPILLYVDPHMSDDLCERRLTSFLRTNKIEPNSVYHEAVLTDNWINYVNTDDEHKRYALYRKWLMCLNKVPKTNHRDWGQLEATEED